MPKNLEEDLDHLYKHLPNRFTSAEGFLFLQDDTVLNYWNLVQALDNRQGVRILEHCFIQWRQRLVRKTRRNGVNFQVSYKKHMKSHDSSLTICNSEVFYVPRRLVNDFKDLVNLVGNLDIHQKVAIPMQWTLARISILCLVQWFI